MAAGRWLSGIAILAVALAVVLAGCSDDPSRHFSDAKIIDKLNLKKSENGYAVNGDPFCEIAANFLNDADEVSGANDHDNLVIESHQGNVGVRAIPAFAPDCKDKVQKKLDKLDAKPKGD